MASLPFAKLAASKPFIDLRPLLLSDQSLTPSVRLFGRFDAPFRSPLGAPQTYSTGIRKRAPVVQIGAPIMSAIFKHKRDDLLVLLRGILNRASVSEPKRHAQALLQEAEASVSLYVARKDAGFQHGEVRKSLLKLWKAAERGEEKPKLTGLLSATSSGAIEYLERRAERIWPSLGLGPLFQNGLLEWAQSATQADLATMLVRCISEGREFVEGRDRPSGRASQGKFEPVILGDAEGAAGKKARKVPLIFTDPDFRPMPPTSKAGRSSIDAEVGLVMSLVNDWHRVTGQLKVGGRSDSNPMVEFVISVFEWAKIDGAENALRIYWSEMKTRKARSAPDIQIGAKAPTPLIQNGEPTSQTPKD